ncbi:ABC transporter ATP-binding protein [Paenibacillus tarimensis]|uniref:ABC transporter ATP-binding protein n=1 Tax=Paenibacillus tarimensis TaxID=416012 RepID=UPI001F2690A1|nr:ABC transporter ATP-binding protein [Paenibacillus tarimensis]MCF2945069.1 ABC transporter ATP-binding protein [Paenibacillus tarimensis]
MQIRIEQLTKTYANQRGINQIDLTLPEGGLTAIVGPSGCGKTTLLRTLAGLIKPDSGAIRFGGKDVTYAPPQHRGATMVFQNYALWPHMSVFDNIAYGLKLRRTPAAEIERRVTEVLRRVEIDPADVKKRHPQQYSGGQQQRIALARALVVQPHLLLMDEPLSNLDAKVRQRLRVEIRNIQQSFGITALYVTHDQEEALSMADYVVLMNEGRIEQAGTPKEVYYQPSSYFTAHFLGDSHTLHVRRGSETRRLVVRSCDMAIGSRAEQLPASAAGEWPLVEAVEGGWQLTGEVTNHLFIGSSYRHMVRVGSQAFFADADEACEPGVYRLHLPAERAYWFELEESAAGAGQRLAGA